MGPSVSSLLSTASAGGFGGNSSTASSIVGSSHETASSKLAEVKTIVEKTYEFVKQLDEDLQAGVAGSTTLFRYAHVSLRSMAGQVGQAIRELEKLNREEPAIVTDQIVAEVRGLDTILTKYVLQVSSSCLQNNWSELRNCLPPVLGVEKPTGSPIVKEASCLPPYLPTGFDDINAGPEIRIGNKSFEEYFTTVKKPTATFSGGDTAFSKSKLKLSDVWRDFHPIHVAPNVTIVEKRNAFLQFFSGKARQLAANFDETTSEEGYKRMISDVFERFSQNTTDTQAYLDELIEIKPSGTTYDELETYLTRVYSIIVRLEQRGRNADDLVTRVWPTIWKAVPEKIWDKVRALLPEFKVQGANFSAAIYEQQPYQKFVALRKFVLQEAKLFGQNPTFEMQAMAAAVRRRGQSSEKQEGPRAQKNTTQRKRLRIQYCEPCESKDHKMSECRQPIETRKQLLLDAKRCLACLAKDHDLQACQRKYLCKRCYRFDSNNAIESIHHWWACPKRTLENPEKRSRLQKEGIVQACAAIVKSEPCSDSEESYPGGSSEEDR